MKTLIVYASKYGCAERCGQKLAHELNGEVVLNNLRKSKPTDLSSYDNVIVGGSIYIGKIQKEVTEFCLANMEALKNKNVGLYICAMREDAIKQELSDAFPQELSEKALAKEHVGGEYKLGDMKFFDRLIVKKVAQVSADVSSIKEDAIKRLASQFNNLN